MKAKEIINLLQKLNPEEEVIALWWDRNNFTIDGFTIGGDEVSESVWNKVCEDFNHWEGIEDSITLSIVESIVQFEEEEEEEGTYK